MINPHLISVLYSLQPQLQSAQLLPQSAFPQLIQPIFIRETLPQDAPYPLNDWVRYFFAAMPSRRAAHQGIDEFSKNPIFRAAHDFYFGGSGDEERTVPWHYGFIGREYGSGESPRFAAALAAFFVLEDHIYTTRRVAEVLALETDIRENVTVTRL